MTEKRFTTSDTDVLCMTIIDNENGKHYGFARDIAIVMNELNDENEQLKKELEDALLDVKIYKNANATFDNVYQENNKLKSRIEYLERKIQRERISAMKEHEKWEKEIQKENEQLKDALNQRTDQCDKYYKENEQLKFQNSNLMKEVAEYSRKAKELELQMLRLYNYFEDWFEDTMSPSNFSEMWGTVKESKKWEKR